MQSWNSDIVVPLFEPLVNDPDEVSKLQGRKEIEATEESIWWGGQSISFALDRTTWSLLIFSELRTNCLRVTGVAIDPNERPPEPPKGPF